MSIANKDVATLIETNLPDAQVTVTGDGYKYEAHIISASFIGLSKIKRHQKIYAILHEVITSGQLHALTLKTDTPDEVTPHS